MVTGTSKTLTYNDGPDTKAYDVFYDLMFFDLTLHAEFASDVTCSLKEVGCATAVGPDINSHISINDVGGGFWEIMAKTNERIGYSKDFCVQCDLLSRGLQAS